jgi:hypothetical protein
MSRRPSSLRSALVVLAASLGLMLFVPAMGSALELCTPSPQAAQAAAPSPAQGIARPASQRGPAVHPEEAAVRVPLDALIRAHATGDEASYRRAFWKEARLWWMRDGQLASRTVEEYIAASAGRRAGPDGPSRRVSTIEINGESATAIIEVDYPSARYVDYLTLVKIGDDWWIASKAYVADRPPIIS